MADEFDLEEFRRQVRATREREWIRDAHRLKDRSPEETIEAMFDLVDFAEKLGAAEKCSP
ncbi:MAG: hypothetical protein D6733_06165 [Methanobacteriota archaeon]|nr:MAG: hypothetical protein D6733_06165 [Euryarchaeota archaeon]